MSACLECGKCPCYEHERRTVYKGAPRVRERPSAGGAAIPILVAFYLGALTVIVCAYMSSR